MAYCFDEAVFMWGTHVEGAISEAANSGKNKRQAEQKVQMVIRQLMYGDLRGVAEESDSETPPRLASVKQAPKKFRDPMSLLGQARAPMNTANERPENVS